MRPDVAWFAHGPFLHFDATFGSLDLLRNRFTRLQTIEDVQADGVLDQLPIEVQQNIDIESYAIRGSGDGSIALRGGSSELEPMGAKGGYIILPDDMEALSEIIRTLNEHFGTDFSEDDKVCIRELEERLAGNEVLDASRRVNTAENVRLTFDSILNDLMQGLVDGHFKFYKQVNDDAEFARAFGDWLFERYLKRAKSG